MDLKERALKVRLLVLDVDGVLTDGRLYYTSRGEEIKVFNVKDGFGIKMAQMAGIRVGVISGRKSKALGKRLEELGIEEAHLGFNEKLPVLEDMLRRLSRHLQGSALYGPFNATFAVGPYGHTFQPIYYLLLSSSGFKAIHIGP